jgi:hypothetical protein
MVCSFFDRVDRSILDKPKLARARAIARVMLGVSTSSDDIGVFFRYMPQQLVAFTASVELAVSLSDAILEIGTESPSFRTNTKQFITESLEYAYTLIFGGCKLCDIGSSYSASIQRLVYNTVACTVSSIHYSHPGERGREYMRNCTLLLVDLTSALKCWMADDTWLRGWSGCHALLICIDCTVEQSVLVHPYAPLCETFLYFCDALAECVCLENKHILDATNVSDVTNSFGWCAFSKRWTSILHHKSTNMSNKPWILKLAATINMTLNTDVTKLGVSTSASNDRHSRPSSPTTPHRGRTLSIPSSRRVAVKTIVKPRRHLVVVKSAWRT